MLKRSLLALSMLTASLPSAFSQQSVLPSNPNVKTNGRIDTSNPERFRFDYPGVHFTLKFTGSTTIAAKIKASKETYFQAFVDGKPVLDQSGRQAIYTSLNDTTIVLANKLKKAQSHEVVLYKRTENLDNKPAEFMGFVLDTKATCMQPTSASRTRKIEFLGNSITCAFGTEAKNKDSKFEAETENNYLSYANILARAFDADANLVAHSGRGAIRNYNDPDMESTKIPTVPKLFLNTLDSDTSFRWDYSRFVPDAVVINLGTNDYSTAPHPYKSLFFKGYLKLIAQVRAAYGNSTQIFCIVGPMIDEPCYSYVKEIVEWQKLANKDPRIHFIGIPRSLLALDKDYGAAYHPGGDGQKKMAQVVAPIISTVMDWSYNRSEMDDIKGGQDFYSREK